MTRLELLQQANPDLPIHSVHDPVARTAPFLWVKNKWLVTHEDNTQLLLRGATAGIRGTNWTLAPIKEKES